MWFLRRHLTASVWLDLRCLRCICRAQQCCSSACTRRTLSKYLNTTLYLGQTRWAAQEQTLSPPHLHDTPHGSVPATRPPRGRQARRVATDDSLWLVYTVEYRTAVKWVHNPRGLPAVGFWIKKVNRRFHTALCLKQPGREKAYFEGIYIDVLKLSIKRTENMTAGEWGLWAGGAKGGKLGKTTEAEGRYCRCSSFCAGKCFDGICVRRKEGLA